MKFLVTPRKADDGFITVECPSLPGCWSRGGSEAEALNNIREAIALSLETRRANNIPTDRE
jgi:predicted RNase H-like HicB family nuclease